ncbi:MAG: hypothetical protein SVX38_06325, partial [Chloroflexota bacterium]|nr:hypothetical protein [Chloroflexota bacterium]
YLCLLCHATVERVGDINRDGEWETQILLIILHADSAGYEPYILRWTPDDIEVLFGQEYRWWKQQVYWQVGDDGTIIVDEPYFDFYCELGGMLGANLCRRQITTYRWRDGAYRVDSTVVTPPQTTFQQLAIADEFLYAGQYDQALYAYRQLVHWAIPLSEPQGHPHGCRAIGWLRLGALYARLGDERNAQNAMIQAQAAYLDCASAYLATYAETDSTLDALFALWRTTEHTDYECAGVNIKPTLLCLEAYLVAHPHQAADEIFQGLNALGLEVTTVVEDDLNSDGLREVIIVQSGSDSYNTLWLLVQCGSDWMAIKIEFGEALTVEEIVDVPGTSARAVVFTCDKSCDYAAIGWDGHVPVFYKDTDTFEMAEPVGYYSYYRTGWDGRRCDH